MVYIRRNVELEVSEEAALSLFTSLSLSLPRRGEQVKKKKIDRKQESLWTRLASWWTAAAPPESAGQWRSFSIVITDDHSFSFVDVDGEDVMTIDEEMQLCHTVEEDADSHPSSPCPDEVDDPIGTSLNER